MKTSFYDIDAYPQLLKDLSSYDLDQDVLNRLSIHLNRVYLGNDDVYVTPICKVHGAENVLSGLNKVFDDNIHKMNDTLIDLEYSNKGKFGPRSVSIPWPEREKNLSESFGLGKLDIHFEMEPLDRGTLRPISLNKALLLLKNNTNSGLPYYTRKGKVKQRAFDDFNELMKFEYPCILFTRTQEQNKTRDVWGYPIADTMNEMRYYAPLLDYQRKLEYRAALISPDAVSRGITRIIKYCNTRDRYIVVSIDFKAYDKSFRAKLQKASFHYIKSKFQIRYHYELDTISGRFRTIGIVTPTAILKGDHGVPSGSPFTNEVDSIGQVKAKERAGFVINDDEFQVQGDDGVYLVPEDRVDEFYQCFEDVGLDINRDKSYLSKDYAIYLQCLFHKDYESNGIISGIYPIYRALNRILFQERWSTFEDYDLSGKDYYSIRTLCILENCKYHPLFREFVKFVYELDKYSLDPSDQGISHYVQMMESIQGAGEILNHQHGDNFRGIKSFESYKLAREMG